MAFVGDGPSPHSRKIATGALLTALGWLLLFGAGFLPTGRLFVLTLASFVLLIAWRELGMRSALLVYLLVSLLALLSPGLVTAAQFGLFFGPLPLIWLWLRGALRLLWARLLTHLMMSALIIVLMLLMGTSFLALQVTRLPVWLLMTVAVALLQVFLLVYLYALQQFELFYGRRIRPPGRPGP